MLNSTMIGNKIATARKKINLSQADLAQKISISPQAVGKWERGESMPDISTLNRLAEIFGVDLNYFSDNFPSSDSVTANHESIEKPAIGISNLEQKKRFDWNWDMSEGNWVDADFSGLKDLKDKFSSSNIKNCKFINSDLSELILEKNNIELCDFSGSDIRGSKIQSSNLLTNNFNKCSLIDSELFKSNIEKCNFSETDFSGAEIIETNLESNDFNTTIWKFTKFLKSNISNITFTGIFENCHFEHCSFYKVKFENATILNTFFKYNERFKKVQFVNCRVDSLTYAFLKSNGAILEGISIIESTTKH